MASGTCLCGNVAWEIDGPFEVMQHCHCTKCRKSHGTAFATFVTFARESFRWVRGEEGIRRYASSPGSERAFCGRCGSKLPALEPFAYAFAAPLVGELGVVPSAHLCVADQAPWHVIRDELPRHAGLPDAGTTFATPRTTEAAADRVRGSCLCGTIAYELEGPLEGGAIVCCHCSRCRRARAAVHGSNLFVDTAVFKWLRGEEQLVAFKLPEAARFTQSFCGVCGSVMPTRHVPGPFRAVPCGTLDDDPGAREGLHIMVAHRAPWFEVGDALPSFAEYPPAGFPPVARRRPT